MPCKAVFLHYLIIVVPKVGFSAITKDARQFMFTKSLSKSQLWKKAFLSATTNV